MGSRSSARLLALPVDLSLQVPVAAGDRDLDRRTYADHRRCGGVHLSRPWILPRELAADVDHDVSDGDESQLAADREQSLSSGEHGVGR